jgi:hypothetical protein
MKSFVALRASAPDRRGDDRRRLTALLVVLFGDGPGTVSAAKRWHTPVAA